ncbi:hypothetical protein BDV93DRAFT_512799 [Ceratobasidium sp. AG-I]|nr:hypothetical protein BDV93DRAFT_512799 [Ceratobasidium sp. AG-I]
MTAISSGLITALERSKSPCKTGLFCEAKECMELRVCERGIAVHVAKPNGSGVISKQNRRRTQPNGPLNGQNESMLCEARVVSQMKTRVRNAATSSRVQTPEFQEHLRESQLSKIKQRKSEWGRPIEKLIPNTNAATLIDFDGEPPSDNNVRAAIHLIQSTNLALPAPTCESFRTILRLMLDPGRLNLLNETTLLPSCIRLLREHVRDTNEPVIVLTVQMAMVCRGHGFETFRVKAKRCILRLIPEFITTHTWLQIETSNLADVMAWIHQASTTPNGRRLLLPTVGGFTDVDAAFLVKEMWQSRKQFSYIGAKVPTHGWSFVIQIIAEHYLTDSMRKKKRDSVLWAFLEALSHRYALFSAPIETDHITDIPKIGTVVCTDETERGYLQRMIDKQDARTVVESYIARMTPKAGVAPLPTLFCSTLVDFVFQHEISALGGLLAPLLKVWRMGLQLGMWSGGEILSSMWLTHWDVPSQMLLMRTNLSLSVEVDQTWAKLVKFTIRYSQTIAYSQSFSFAATLFEDQYIDWTTTMSYIQRQILY